MPSLIKTAIYKIYVLGLMVFTVWFAFFLYPVIYGHGADGSEADIEDPEFAAYFGEGATGEEKQLPAALNEQKSTAATEQYVEGRFHHTGMIVEADDTNTCIRCHGSAPHDKTKAIRAFLNMHAFYIACETCHILPKKESGETWVFRWYDKDSGEPISNPLGLTSPDKSMYGNYGAKIAPGTVDSGGNFQFLNGPRERSFVEKYLKEKDRLGSTRRSKMKKVIHRKVNDEPLLCNGCHASEGDLYLPFAKLGYPKRRMQDLTGAEVAGMAGKHQEFKPSSMPLPPAGLPP